MSAPQDKSLRITCGFYGLCELCVPWCFSFSSGHLLHRGGSHTLFSFSGNRINGGVYDHVLPFCTCSTPGWWTVGITL